MVEFFSISFAFFLQNECLAFLPFFLSLLFLLFFLSFFVFLFRHASKYCSNCTEYIHVGTTRLLNGTPFLTFFLLANSLLSIYLHLPLHYIYIYIYIYQSISLLCLLPPLNTRLKTLFQPRPRLLPKERPQNLLSPLARLDHRPITPFVGRRLRDPRVVRPQLAEQLDDIRPVELVRESEDALRLDVFV